MVEMLEDDEEGIPLLAMCNTYCIVKPTENVPQLSMSGWAL